MPALIASPLRSFLDLRASSAAAPIGDGGPDTCAALTASLDAAIRDLGADLGPGAAVVALGGYGRREQCVWSDVDVMVLHAGGDRERLVRAVLYPLWDANLKVGHAVRTVAECRRSGREDLETLTSLLSARLVVGDEDLFGEFVDALVGLVRSRPLAPALVAQERERRRRDPYPVMAADVKDGRGALRTHQGFWWERRRAVLLGLPVDEPGDDEARARATLLEVRNALHAAAGRAADRFVVGLREPAAAWLGTDLLSLASRLTAALDLGDRLADRRWPDLHVEQDPLVGFGRRVVGRVRSRFSLSSEEPADGVLALAVRAAERREGAWFDAREEAAIRGSAPAKWTAADRTAFLRLLSAGSRGRSIFARLDEIGWLEREFPEWRPVATAPQLAPFHDHPVGAHLWRTVDEMRLLIDGGGETGALAAELGSTEELILAAFLHDIGKARGGDHATIGAALAEGFLRRHGFGPDIIGAVVDAVRRHLLLSETATRRDLADRRVIDEVAAVVGDVRRLDILYLLTIADLRATGTTMWSSWRGTLLKTLYGRVREALRSGGAPPATPDVEAVMVAAPPGTARRSVEEHVAAMLAGYLDSTTPREVVWHLEVVDRLDAAALLAPDPEDETRVLVVGRDRAGFLLAVCRAFTAHGVGVLDARLRTRADGVAVDTFHVVDDRTGEPISASRWRRVAVDLIDSLEGRRDLRPVIRERERAYRRPDRETSPVRVAATFGGRFTVIEVRAPDRVGLLAAIVEALHGEGLDIHLARIDTMGGEARDVFYTRRVGGVPVTVDAELAALRRRLEDRLRPT